jgi:amyloid beta precursor protein binding protein 1
MATDNKYDRQLRLWGAHGQKCLSEARICLLNAGATGTEALKNLVLPGMGHFTIVDGEKVSEAECASNFFVTSAELGAPRARVTRDLLVEMNADVHGEFVVQDPDTLIDDNAKFFADFDVVIATQLSEHYAARLSEICTNLNVPLVIARSYGLLGQVRLVAREHCVVESKPSPEPAVDVRIANPFPELLAYAEGVNLSELNDKDYKHVPYIAVLVKLVQEWKAAHGGDLPKTTQDKADFRALIKKMARKPWGEEENLDEAMAFAYFAFGARPTPYDVQDVLDKAPTVSLADTPIKSQPFWALAKGLAAFVTKENGVLPLSGKLPDMTATTEMYIELQQLFRDKAEADQSSFSALVDEALTAAGLPTTTVSLEERRRFCANAYLVQVSHFRSLKDELESPNSETAMMATMEGVGDATAQCPLLWYLALRACDRFYASESRYPGTGPVPALVNLEEDTTKLFALIEKLASEYGLDSSALSVSHAKEMVRFGAGEIHNTAALVGGIVSQETIKLLTAQYIPLNNTYIYNGIACIGGVYAL